MQRHSRWFGGVLTAVVAAASASAEPAHDMVPVPAGPFLMGDPAGLARDGLPVHEVVTDAFLIDRCEVTARQVRPALEWARARGWVTFDGPRVRSTRGGRMGLFDFANQPCPLLISNGVVAIRPGMEDHPCVGVTWFGALAYGAIRTAMENERGAGLAPCVSIDDWSCNLSATGYRLPTEAEWEKAARGGLRGQHFPWPDAGGDSVEQLAPGKANYIAATESAGNGPRPVGSYRGGAIFLGSRHPWDLYDFAGNVAEWCLDWYDADLYAALPAKGWPRNPTGPPESPWDGRVLRGGSWFSIGEHLRCAHRSHLSPEQATLFAGFRTVRRPAAGAPGVPQARPARAAFRCDADGWRLAVEADWLEQDVPRLRAGGVPDFGAAASNAWRRLEATIRLVRAMPGAAAMAGTSEEAAVRTNWPAADATAGVWREAWREIRWARRRVLFAGPALDFESILFLKGVPPRFTSNIVDQYFGRWSRPGTGIARLDHWRETPVECAPFAGRMPVGAVQNFDLAFDGRRVAFSFCDHTETNPAARAFFLWDGHLADGSVRRLTGDPARDPLRGEDGCTNAVIEDFDPCHLPDGGLAFLSTRCQSFSRCQAGRYAPSYVLHRIDADGGGLRRLAFLESNEWTPCALDDGRLLFTQWDYVNRHEVLFQGLWTCRPDGTGLAHVYGNYTANPCAVMHARPEPGARTLVAVASAHHSNAGGSLVRIDPARGQDGEAPLERLTPEICFPETEGWPAGAWSHPWPLGGGVVLASYSPDTVPFHWELGRRNAGGLYILDPTGGRELVWRDAEESCLRPVPLRPRAPPAVIGGPPVPPGETQAIVVVQNVCRGTSFKPGEIRRVRVVRLYEQRPQSAVPRSVNQIEFARGIVGSAPVAADGSAAFAVPANAPLLFQLLDERGRAVMTMRSQAAFQPGERRSCAGCHESRLGTPPAEACAWRGRVEPLRPPAGPRYEGGFDFARTVQPVLDRHCVRCHGPGGAAAALDLRGMPAGPFSTAYLTLTGRPGLTGMAWRRQESERTRPYEYGAAAARLLPVLQEAHRDRVRLDGESMACLIEWLDLNAPFRGDYESAPAGGPDAAVVPPCP